MPVERPNSEFMNAKPTNLLPSILDLEALKVMEDTDREFNVLPIVENGEFKGVI